MPSTFKQRARRLLHGQGDAEPDEDDEETLQLRLEAIEAKLKLKKLRQAKGKGPISSSDVEDDRTRTPATSTRPVSTATLRSARRQAGTADGLLSRAKSQPDVVVPLSPPPRRTVPEDPTSPGRIRLGIDKGRTGRDMSLRRAPNLRESNTPGADVRTNPQSTDGASIRRAPPASSRDGVTTRLKTFSERMADSRAEEKNRRDKECQLQRERSKKFDIDEKEMQRLKTASKTEDDPFMAEARTSEPREYTREEVLQSYNKPAGGLVKRSNTIGGSVTGQRSDSRSTVTSMSSTASNLRSTPSLSSRSSSSTVIHRPIAAPSEQHDDPPPPDPASEFEAFSCQHLSKRVLPHSLLTRTFTDKATLLIPDLLKTVKSPEFDAPDVADFVVLGVIASKSSPKTHKDDHLSRTNGEKTKNGRSKYMVLTLTDLKWELDLFLFGAGFERFWKLTPGTVIAILNPAIMPPPAHKRDTGKFSLTLNSSDDTVLEIGSSRDLGFCASVKKDGKTCEAWVDTRHTAYCSFHVDASLRKTKASRMEVNTMTAPFAPGGRSGSRTGMFGARSGTQNDKSSGPSVDRATHSHYYIAPAGAPNGGSSARLLDDDDVDPDAFHRGANKEERLRRRLAEREREREIARQLGDGGNGAGSMYLRAPLNGLSAAEGGCEEASRAVDAQALGLLADKGKAASVRLSPVKRKRGGDGGAGPAVGWAGASKPSRPREPVEPAPPARKKTRFVTERGIREAGRESLGGAVPAPPDEDDDDGLEIV